MFNLLVTTMTLIALGFVVAWWLRQDVRDSMEFPKHRFARWADGSQSSGETLARTRQD
jgi:hypothetical protein